MRKLWFALDPVLVVVCVFAAIASWRKGIRTTWFPATTDFPAFEATRYSGPWLVLAAVLVAVAGLAVIDLVARGLSGGRLTAGRVPRNRG